MTGQGKSIIERIRETLFPPEITCPKCGQGFAYAEAEFFYTLTGVSYKKCPHCGELVVILDNRAKFEKELRNGTSNGHK